MVLSRTAYRRPEGKPDIRRRAVAEGDMMARYTSCTTDPSSVRVQSWRVYTPAEMREYLGKIRDRPEAPSKKPRKINSSILVVREKISTLDMYCYLKARFGEPNGFQTFLAKDDSDNWIHWDYNIKAESVDIHISGMSRETHILTSEDLTDEQWRDLIVNLKADFSRVGREKSEVLKSLEKWTVFQNRFVDIANACGDKHALIVEFLSSRPKFNSLSVRNKHSAMAWSEAMSEENQLRADMSRSCLELSLLTPVMAEALINMTILMLCKPEIRNNKRQFDSFIRSHIDAKIFDLPYKCRGFSSSIDPNSAVFVNFKRVMDKRNHTIHGNVDPDRERIETVYFDRKRPLYAEAGDHIGKFIESIERQAQPEVIVKDYENTHEFLAHIASCLERNIQAGFWRIMEDAYPGLDAKRKIVGALFPGHVITGHFDKMKYDSDLNVVW